jgi:capsular polysaccharide transport system permease protein
MGYLWALLEPLLMIVTFFTFYAVAGRKAPSGFDNWTFLTSAIVPYNLFTHSVNRVAESIHGNKPLLFYPHVFPLDLAIARALLEGATQTGVFIVLILLHALHEQELVIHQPLLVVYGFGLAALLGSSLGLVFCALGQLSNLVDRARGPLLRPLFWASGIFFTAASLSERVRKAVLWNPVLHCIELVRAGVFPTYENDYARPSYVLVWCFAFGVIGLSLERVVRARIELT